MKSIAPFLMINEECKDAFMFYKKIFNASILQVDYMHDDIIGLNNEDLKGKLKHIWLQINNSIDLRGCNRSVFFNEFKIHLPFSVMIIDADSKNELIELYEELSYKGRSIISVRSTNQFTSFCMTLDQFGIYWIIIYNSKTTILEDS